MSAGRRAVCGVALVSLGAALGACGQKGALYAPTAPEARDRATLPQTLRPSLGTDAPAVPAAPASAASGAAR